jgi:hypothetical protein
MNYPVRTRYRSQNRSHCRQLQRPQLGEPMAVPRPSFPRLPVAL